MAGFENAESKRFGNRLRSARGSRKQEDLAQACGVSASAVSMWESGAAVPTYQNLVYISEALHVRIDWLMFGRHPVNIESTIDESILEKVLSEIMKALERKNANMSADTLAKVASAYYRYLVDNSGADWRGTLDALITLAERG